MSLIVPPSQETRGMNYSVTAGPGEYHTNHYEHLQPPISDLHAHHNQYMAQQAAIAAHNMTSLSVAQYGYMYGPMAPPSPFYGQILREDPNGRMAWLNSTQQAPGIFQGLYRNPEEAQDRRLTRSGGSVDVVDNESVSENEDDSWTDDTPSPSPMPSKRTVATPMTPEPSDLRNHKPQSPRSINPDAPAFVPGRFVFSPIREHRSTETSRLLQHAIGQNSALTPEHPAKTGEMTKGNEMEVPDHTNDSYEKKMERWLHMDDDEFVCVVKKPTMAELEALEKAQAAC
ncbi:Protein of unknown function [Pyronema omphalodes CBS 100304]|uniref:Uncharacterized protein n=1 Tax=Pyronema omphalodes (strain CBS 100304) TaxID=1076935 RepID=U4L8Z5_PYROM|nr:Protein of unknown function [Pyronema omphalodes CBS 100304]